METTDVCYVGEYIDKEVVWMEQNYRLIDTNDKNVLEYNVEKTCEDVLFSEVVAE